MDDSSERPHRFGVGVFQTLAFFNHSCRPTCTYAVHTAPAAPAAADGGAPCPPTAAFVQVTALRDINAGEELTITYCDPFQGRWQRRRELWVRGPELAWIGACARQSRRSAS